MSHRQHHETNNETEVSVHTDQTKA